MTKSFHLIWNQYKKKLHYLEFSKNVQPNKIPLKFLPKGQLISKQSCGTITYSKKTNETHPG